MWVNRGWKNPIFVLSGSGKKWLVGKKNLKKWNKYGLIVLVPSIKTEDLLSFLNEKPKLWVQGDISKDWDADFVEFQSSTPDGPLNTAGYGPTPPQ